MSDKGVRNFLSVCVVSLLAVVIIFIASIVTYIEIREPIYLKITDIKEKGLQFIQDQFEFELPEYANIKQIGVECHWDGKVLFSVLKFHQVRCKILRDI